ncbi:MAG: hypothetical protein WA820_10880 [Bradyrhizobium sp.]|jgi:hypothetical protein
MNHSSANARAGSRYGWIFVRRTASAGSVGKREHSLEPDKAEFQGAGNNNQIVVPARDGSSIDVAPQRCINIS